MYAYSQSYTRGNGVSMIEALDRHVGTAQSDLIAPSCGSQRQHHDDQAAASLDLCLADTIL